MDCGSLFKLASFIKWYHDEHHHSAMRFGPHGNRLHNPLTKAGLCPRFSQEVY